MDFSFTEKEPFSESPFKRSIKPQVVQTYYDILGVDSTTSKVTIREVYIRLKKTYGGTSQALYSLLDDEGAHEAMAQIEEAFRVLDDDRSREKYDEKLGIRPSTSSNENSFLSSVSARLGLKSKIDDERASSFKSDFAKMVDDQSSKVRGVGVSRLTHPKIYRDEVEKMCKERDLSDGVCYREIREQMSLTLTDVYNQTRIMVNHLTSIEENNYSQLPAAVFTRGFVRSYLQFLGVADFEQWTARYMEKFTAWHKQKKS